MALLYLRDDDGNFVPVPYLIGEPGPKGETGKTAYQSAQEGGYSGSEAEFYADLAAMQNLAAILAEI